MKIIESSKIKEKAYVEKLESGMQVIIIPKQHTKKKYVILFLEGDFGTKTRTKKMIMKELQDSMNKKLRWIDCRVSVVDSDTYDPRIFQIVS